MVVRVDYNIGATSHMDILSVFIETNQSIIDEVKQNGWFSSDFRNRDMGYRFYYDTDNTDSENWNTLKKVPQNDVVMRKRFDIVLEYSKPFIRDLKIKTLLELK